MIIKPGSEDPSVADQIELVRLSSKRRVDIMLYDSANELADVLEEQLPSGEPKGELDLQVTNLAGDTIYEESYFPPDNPPKGRIIHPSTGRYYLNFGEVASETSTTGTFLFNWHVRQNELSEDSYRTQVVEIISPRVLSLFPRFRLMIDKTVKPNLPSEDCFLGYTDGMLSCYLIMGLHMINSYEPYPVWQSLEYFPIELHSEILLKAALFQGIISQTMFAIDTDVPSYSDQGHSFVLQHATPLMGLANAIHADLDKVIPIFKKRFVASGTLGVEMRLNAAYYALLTSAPSGSIFRNFWLAQPS